MSEEELKPKTSKDDEQAEGDNPEANEAQKGQLLNKPLLNFGKEEKKTGKKKEE